MKKHKEPLVFTTEQFIEYNGSINYWIDRYNINGTSGLGSYTFLGNRIKIKECETNE